MLKSFRQMISASGSYAPELKFSLTLSIIASTIQGIVFALFFPLFSALLTSPIDTQRVWTLVALIAFLVVIEFLIRWRELEFGWIITIDAASEMRLKLGEQLRKMPLEELSRRRSGELNVILSGNVTDSLHAIGNLSSIIIKTIIVPTIVIIVTLFIDWRLAIAMLITFPLAIPIYRWQKSVVAKGTRDVAIADANTASRIIEYAQGIPVLRATQQVGKQ